MRGYAHGLLYNELDTRTMSYDQVVALLAVMGTAPVYPEAGEIPFYVYHGNLLTTAKNMLQEAYGVSAQHMVNL